MDGSTDYLVADAVPRPPSCASGRHHPPTTVHSRSFGRCASEIEIEACYNEKQVGPRMSKPVVGCWIDPDPFVGAPKTRDSTSQGHSARAVITLATAAAAPPMSQSTGRQQAGGASLLDMLLLGIN